MRQPADLPYVIDRAEHRGDVVRFLDRERGPIDALLTEIGAVLLRDTGVTTPEEFGSAIGGYFGGLSDYTYRSTPRHEAAERIFTSTEYPSDQEIQMHNENAYASRWPRRIAFCCLVPAESGGATPIADSRHVAREIDPAVHRRFSERGVMYVRTYHQYIDLPWSEVFQTNDRAEVARVCDALSVDYEWDGDTLKTRQIRPGLANHPVTGEEVWFNQAHLFHPSALPSEARMALVAALGEAALPRQCFYGDGSAIDDEDLERIRDVYRASAVDVDWRRGDVLILDNMLVAHGRRSYGGARQVLVAMEDA